MTSTNKSNDTQVIFDDDDDIDVDDSMISEQAEDDRQSHQPTLAHNETKVVSLFRIILMLVLVVTAIAVSLLAYFENRNGEIDDFEETFESHAQKVRTLGSFFCVWQLQKSPQSQIVDGSLILSFLICSHTGHCLV